MITALLSSAASAAISLLTAVSNLLTDAFLTPPLEASLAHLEDAELRPLSAGESGFGAAQPPAECDPLTLVPNLLFQGAPR